MLKELLILQLRLCNFINLKLLLLSSLRQCTVGSLIGKGRVLSFIVHILIEKFEKFLICFVHQCELEILRICWLLGTITAHHSPIVVHKSLSKRIKCRGTIPNKCRLRLLWGEIRNSGLFQLENYLFFLRNQGLRFYYLRLNELRPLNFDWRHFRLSNSRFHNYLYLWLRMRHWRRYLLDFFYRPFLTTILNFFNIFKVRKEALLHFLSLIVILFIKRVFFPVRIVIIVALL